MPPATATAPDEPVPADGLAQHLPGQERGEHDARLADGGDRGGGGALEREQDERIRAEGRDPGDERGRPQLGAQLGGGAPAEDRGRVDE